MSIAYWVTGSTLDVLRKLPDDSMDLVLSSPPFFALRSYLDPDDPNKADEIGSEATPGEFLDVLLDVTEECLRVLAPHGTLAFELGDTYSDRPGVVTASKWHGGKGREERSDSAAWRRPGNAAVESPKGGAGFPLDKSLCLIPESYRFALAYGRNPFTGRECSRWRVRNVIRWVRPNPPVGALGDKFRPATSELVVACQSRTRYFDLDAVRESPRSGEAGAEFSSSRSNTGYSGLRKPGAPGASDQKRLISNPAGAPPLDWWEIPTHPYPGSHYATWPPALCVKPIEAMCPTKVCVTCGEPSRRITSEPEYVTAAGENQEGDEAWRHGRGGDIAGPGSIAPTSLTRTVETIGWFDCGHNTWRAGRVLDPFAGSGTTLSVATGHGREAIGIDLDIRNLELARNRVGMFLQESCIDEIGGLL